MQTGIYSAVSGGLAAQSRLDAVANNLANASTPGFKAERFVQRADVAGNPAPRAPVVSTSIARGRSETDFSQGPLEHTGNPLDVALSGPGFLVVATDRGERLTRRGNLGLDAGGFLSTSDGLRLQGEGGEISVPAGPVAIDPDGTVRANGQSVGKLRVVTVQDPAQLVRESGTLFAAGSQPLTSAAAGDVQVVQGAVEGANVSPVQGLVALIDVMRGFEAYVRAAERLDQTTARAITEVGRV